MTSVAQAYINQRKLDSEAKQLQQNIGQFSKTTAQWLELMEKLNKSVNVRVNLVLILVDCNLPNVN